MDDPCIGCIMKSHHLSAGDKWIKDCFCWKKNDHLNSISPLK